MTDPFYTDDSVTLYHGDCLDVLRELPDASVDAVVTDPPYELEFMGRHWDASGIAFRPDVWAECLRVLKPGGHMLAFGGSRTWHRLAAAVEDAGFEIRDSIAWLYGSGFPKSLDVSKAIDKAAGAERGGEATRNPRCAYYPNPCEGHADAEKSQTGQTFHADMHAPATPEAEAWQGWGTALKPAFEPIVVARKPLAGTVAGNVLAWGTGALNIDASRVGTDEDTRRNAAGGDNGLNGESTFRIRERRAEDKEQPAGRWPSNVVLDESQAAELDKQSGVSRDGVAVQRNGGGQRIGSGTIYSGSGGGVNPDVGYGGEGGASRFFPTFKYEPKAPTTERPRDGQTAHPTVKPLDLMRWLVRLVTPPGGIVLEPFAGSGTTAEACVIEGFNCIAIEREADYLPLIVQRLSKPIQVALDFDSL